MSGEAEKMAERLDDCDAQDSWGKANSLMDEAASLIRSQAERIRVLEAEAADLKTSVVGFVAIVASEQGRRYYGDPLKIHAGHYDLMKRCGARMDDFIRVSELNEMDAGEALRAALGGLNG